MDSEVIVIGAGIAGLAFAEYYNKRCLILEKEDFAGGLAYTKSKNGFYFDRGIHVSFTKETDVVTYIAANCRYNSESIVPYNYYYGTFIPHPIQCNLNGLNKELISKCIIDFLDTPDKIETDNFYDWLRDSLGKTIAEEFSYKYNKKIWNYDLKDITTEWINNRTYKPSIKEIIDGALGLNKDKNFYYYTVFRYPIDGGFYSFFKNLENNKAIEYLQEVKEIDLKRRYILTSKGKIYYDKLISTLPLKDLVNLTKDPPLQIIEAKNDLHCNKILLINYMLKDINIPLGNNCKWIYFYDEDIPFARLHFPYLLSRNLVPENKFSVQVEIYASDVNDFKHSADEYLELAVNALIKSGIIKDKNDIIDYFYDILEYAYVIFNKRRKMAVELIRSFYETHRIYTCGRFGEWDYLWSDQSFLSGKKLAEKLNKTL